jgi:hypothetical protein
MARLFLADRGLAVQLLPSALLASSTSFSLWAVSGMELALFTLLVLAGSYLFLRDLGEGAPNRRGMALSGLLLGLASLTRPEGPVFIVLMVPTMLLGGQRRDQRLRCVLAFCLSAAAILLPYYAWRLAYYGHLVPNTYYVKAAGGMYAIQHGLSYLKKLLVFNHNGVLMGLALIGVLSGRNKPAKVFAFGSVLAFTSYMVKIGGDILPMYRLYAPCLPFLYLLAAAGAASVVDMVDSVISKAGAAGAVSHDTGQQVRGAAIWSVTAGCIFVALSNFSTGLGHSEYGGVLKALERSHIAVGRLLDDIHVPGDKAIAQDMGAVPYYAGNVRFVDVIGLTDRRVAREMYDVGYTPYVRYLMWGDPAARQRIDQVDDRLKEYLLSLDCRYIIFNVHMPGVDRDAVLGAIDRKDATFFQPHIAANTFYHNLGSDSRFIEGYRLRRGWPYSLVYYLLLYERVPHPPS